MRLIRILNACKSCLALNLSHQVPLSQVDFAISGDEKATQIYLIAEQTDLLVGPDCHRIQCQASESSAGAGECEVSSIVSRLQRG